MNKGMRVVWSLCMLVVWVSCTIETKPGQELSLEGSAPAELTPVNDAQWLKEFEQKATQYMQVNEVTSADTLKQQLIRKQFELADLQKPSTAASKDGFYSSCQKGVLMMGKVYHCGQCPENHISTASAFVISGDGICATNYHVFKSYDPSRPNEYVTQFVMDREKNVYPVIEVLAASKKDDLAVFRIDAGGKQLQPLAIGEQKAPGETIHLISHPDHRFYTYTSGQINRHYFKPGTTKIRQSISAEFAKGSSGAPVMDNYGNVVGVVAGTQNIYYDPKGEIYQATIKEIIPVSRLKALIE